jgi:hypothetical protein
MMWLQAALLIATFDVAGASVSLPQAGVHAGERRAPPSQVSSGAKARPKPPVKPALAERSSLQGIRMEIQRRLPFLKSCLDAARRGGAEPVSRLQATWSIAPDGYIKDIALEQGMDPELAACLAKAGGRRFPIAPGMELTVPVSIVFVK